MTRPEYYLTFTEDHFLLSEGDPPEVEWGQRDCYGVRADLLTISRGEMRGLNVLKVSESGYHGAAYGVDDIPAGATAYVVLVHYTDGDTFGYEGYWTVSAVKASREDADEVVRRVEDPNDRPGGRYLREWDGYFSGLESVEVVSMVVQP